MFLRNPQDRPSAAELQKHPYLTLPNGWRFELSELERPRRFPSLVLNKSRRSIKPTRHLKHSSVDSGPHIPPVPPLPAPLPLGDTTTSDMLHPSIIGSRQPSQCPHLDGPRLVFITPPSSPVREASRAGPSNEPSDASGPPGLQRMKGFHVVNADPEPDPNKVPSIYNPPPLPGVDNKSPYSARLAPSLHHAPYSPPIVRQSTQVHSTQSTVRHPAPYHFDARKVDRPEIESSRREGDDNDDSDDSDFGTSLWKRPPADLTAGRLTDGLSRTASSRSSQIKKALLRVSSHHGHAPWAPRPAPDEVYDHLQEFFPHHDLDKAIIEVNHAESTPEPKTTDDRRRHAKKSIRMVAEEQITRNQIGMRRKTKLWDSNVEELRM